MLDAFVIERTHLTVKRVAEHIRNTSEFEASCMAALITRCWSDAATEAGGAGLRGHVERWPGADGIFIADSMEVHSVDMCVDDVVYYGETAGIVRGCCCQNHRDLTLLVEPLDITRVMSCNSHVVRFTNELAVWPATHVKHAVAWRHVVDELLVLR